MQKSARRRRSHETSAGAVASALYSASVDYRATNEKRMIGLAVSKSERLEVRRSRCSQDHFIDDGLELQVWLYSELECGLSGLREPVCRRIIMGWGMCVDCASCGDAGEAAVEDDTGEFLGKMWWFGGVAEGEEKLKRRYVGCGGRGHAVDKMNGSKSCVGPKLIGKVSRVEQGSSSFGDVPVFCIRQCRFAMGYMYKRFGGGKISETSHDWCAGKKKITGVCSPLQSQHSVSVKMRCNGTCIFCAFLFYKTFQ
ncbi:hypothetical protein KFK09_019766 [Dendrobium nobile]|uniref:Uncharacterized protein n=1 Tax=Dendrobium nobile TaxID=94219 RepID=A0A8T3AS19_DENNO|nr:hypothetical protein KFK09_019766 [Dendrobium nobile]